MPDIEAARCTRLKHCSRFQPNVKYLRLELTDSQNNCVTNSIPQLSLPLFVSF